MGQGILDDGEKARSGQPAAAASSVWWAAAAAAAPELQLFTRAGSKGRALASHKGSASPHGSSAESGKKQAVRCPWGKLALRLVQQHHHHTTPMAVCEGVSMPVVAGRLCIHVALPHSNVVMRLLGMLWEMTQSKCFQAAGVAAPLLLPARLFGH